MPCVSGVVSDDKTQKNTLFTRSFLCGNVFRLHNEVNNQTKKNLPKTYKKLNVFVFTFEVFESVGFFLERTKKFLTFDFL